MKRAKILLIASIIFTVVGIPIRWLKFGDITDLIIIDAIAVGSNTINYLIEKSRQKKSEIWELAYQDLPKINNAQNGDDK